MTLEQYNAITNPLNLYRRLNDAANQIDPNDVPTQWQRILSAIPLTYAKKINAANNPIRLIFSADEKHLGVMANVNARPCGLTSCGGR